MSVVGDPVEQPGADPVGRHEFTRDSEASGARQRLYFLDGLRALCALYIVVGHVCATAKPPARVIHWIFGPGTLSVGLFLVLSGFSLRLSLARSAVPYRSYMRRRAWRILPPYFASLVISVVLILTVIGHKTGTHWDITLPLSWLGVLVHSVLMQDFFPTREPNHVFWSIAIEWHLYFVLPLLILVARRFGRIALLALTAIGTALLWTIWGGVSYVGFPPQMLVLFVFGIIAADLYLGSGPETKWLRRRLRPGPVTLVAFGAAALGAELAHRYPNYFLASLVIGVAACALILSLGWDAGNCATRRVLECRPLVWVGFFSYSLYLIHAPLVQIVWQYGVHPLHLSVAGTFVATVVGGLAVSLAGAFAFHLVFERPFLNHRSLASLLHRPSPRPSSAEVRPAPVTTLEDARPAVTETGLPDAAAPAMRDAAGLE